MSNLGNTIDRLAKGLESMASKLLTEESLDRFLPDADLIDDGTEYRILLDVPGMAKGQLKVEVVDGSIVVRGERDIDSEATYIKRERRFGTFHRSFSIPEPVHKKDITARFKDGVLTLTVKKNVDEAGDSTIDIQD